MKIAFRNFLTTLRRYKISSLLNVIGLTLAFTAFYVIMSAGLVGAGLQPLAARSRPYLSRGERGLVRAREMVVVA
ncbi:MAG: hypothetical protein ACLUQ6_02965 [Alistipes onderdonkii]